MEEERRVALKAWAEDDRPREKMMLKGRQSLSDAELVAILIGSGNADENAVDLSKRILSDCRNNLHELGKKNIHDLMLYKGIGEAKAVTIAAAMELGRRRKDQETVRRPKINSSLDAFKQFQPFLLDLLHEEFWVLFLNRANMVLGVSQLSMGGMTGTEVDPKIVFRKALEEQAAGIIIAHNHPSGNLKPSEQDISLTKKIREAGKLLEIMVLDHLILAESQYFSFADQGLL